MSATTHDEPVNSGNATTLNYTVDDGGYDEAVEASARDSDRHVGRVSPVASTASSYPPSSTV